MDGITIDFIVKHVRPRDLETLEEMKADPKLLEYLYVHLHLSEGEVRGIFNKWSQAALVGDRIDPGAYVDSAKSVAHIRWGTLYPTKYSTVLFLDWAQIKELGSRATNQPNKTFEFEAADGVPMIVVTISQNGQNDEARLDVKSIEVAANAMGEAVHFSGIKQ